MKSWTCLGCGREIESDYDEGRCARCAGVVLTVDQARAVLETFKMCEAEYWATGTDEAKAALLEQLVWLEQLTEKK